jgi:hypothetical protein
MKNTMKKTTGGFSAIFGRAAGRFLPAFTALALVFTLGACTTETEEEARGYVITVNLNYNGGDDPWFYSLPRGDEEKPTDISGPAIKSGAWDIAVEAHDRSFSIRTNSGASADEYDTKGNGGGNGGVWFTDKKFNTARVSDRAIPVAGGEYAEYMPYTEDVACYVNLMSDGIPVVLNVITYLGYPGGSGTAADPFQRNQADSGNMASFIPYSFNKKGAYTMLGMPPLYTPTNQVYIVRHGDGDGWSKIQLVDAYIENDDFILKIICAPAAE